MTFCRLVTDRDTGKSRGFGFVSFASADDANKAKEELNQSEIDGRTIEVKDADAKPEGGARGERSFGGNDRKSGFGNRGGDRKPGVCYAFQRGECTRGDSCRFSHEGGAGDAGGKKQRRSTGGDADEE